MQWADDNVCEGDEDEDSDDVLLFRWGASATDARLVVKEVPKRGSEEGLCAGASFLGFQRRARRRGALSMLHSFSSPTHLLISWGWEELRH